MNRYLIYRADSKTFYSPQGIHFYPLKNFGLVFNDAVDFLNTVKSMEGHENVEFHIIKSKDYYELTRPDMLGLIP